MERNCGELLKQGIRVSTRTCQEYSWVVRLPGNHGQTWSTFISNHNREVGVLDIPQT